MSAILGAISGAIAAARLRARGPDGAAAALREGRVHMTPQTLRVIGYVRDGVIVVGIIAWAIYVFANPGKVDAFLNWMIGRG